MSMCFSYGVATLRVLLGVTIFDSNYEIYGYNTQIHFSARVLQNNYKIKGYTSNIPLFGQGFVELVGIQRWSRQGGFNKMYPPFYWTYDNKIKCSQLEFFTMEKLYSVNSGASDGVRDMALLFRTMFADFRYNGKM